MKIRMTLDIETIENDVLVTHVETGRIRHAAYPFGVMREVEQLWRDAEQDGAAVAGNDQASAAL